MLGVDPRASDMVHSLTARVKKDAHGRVAPVRVGSGKSDDDVDVVGVRDECSGQFAGAGAVAAGSAGDRPGVPDRALFGFSWNAPCAVRVPPASTTVTWQCPTSRSGIRTMRRHSPASKPILVPLRTASSVKDLEVAGPGAGFGEVEVGVLGVGAGVSQGVAGVGCAGRASRDRSDRSRAQGTRSRTGRTPGAGPPAPER
jgi:hypothetical protein